MTLSSELSSVRKVPCSGILGAGVLEGDNDRSTMRCPGYHLFSCSCPRRKLYRFPLRLWRGQNSIWRTDESRRDDRSAPLQTFRISRHGHFTFNRAKRYGSDKRPRPICQGTVHRSIDWRRPSARHSRPCDGLSPLGSTEPISAARAIRDQKQTLRILMRQD